MDNQVRGLLLGLAAAFVVLFLGLTLAALPSAEPNFASFVTFGLSFLILVMVLVGLIGAIRNPPDEDE
jgi:hypothetical protein